MPPVVKRAKHIRYKISESSGMVQADEMSGESGEVGMDEAGPKTTQFRDW